MLRLLLAVEKVADWGRRLVLLVRLWVLWVLWLLERPPPRRVCCLLVADMDEPNVP